MEDGPQSLEDRIKMFGGRGNFNTLKASLVGASTTKPLEPATAPSRLLEAVKMQPPGQVVKESPKAPHPTAWAPPPKQDSPNLPNDLIATVIAGSWSWCGCAAIQPKGTPALFATDHQPAAGLYLCASLYQPCPGAFPFISTNPAHEFLGQLPPVENPNGVVEEIPAPSRPSVGSVSVSIFKPLQGVVGQQQRRGLGELLWKGEVKGES